MITGLFKKEVSPYQYVRCDEKTISSDNSVEPDFYSKSAKLPKPR